MLEKLTPAIALLDKYKTPYDVVYRSIVYEDDWKIAVQVENGKML